MGTDGVHKKEACGGGSRMTSLGSQTLRWEPLELWGPQKAWEIQSIFCHKPLGFCAQPPNGSLTLRRQ